MFLLILTNSDTLFNLTVIKAGMDTPRVIIHHFTEIKKPGVHCLSLMWKNSGNETGNRKIRYTVTFYKKNGTVYKNFKTSKIRYENCAKGTSSIAYARVVAMTDQNTLIGVTEKELISTGNHPFS